MNIAKAAGKIKLAPVAFIFLLLFQISNYGLTLDDLRKDQKLTPHRFASYFAHFQFVFHSEVQEPETFLLTQSGDCDDYAILADLILKEKGYKTRLITVRMPAAIHVVCYVEEAKGYLDYNNRNKFTKVVSSDGTLQDVALKVAHSFDSRWTSITEFTFENGLKRLVCTVFDKPIYTAKAQQHGPMVASTPLKGL